MCIVCELKAGLQDIKERGEQIHREFDTESALAEAQINIDNATAVGRLVKAAESLIEYGYHDLADRVALQLEKLLPVRQHNRRSGDVGTTNQITPVDDVGPTVASEEPSPAVDEFEGMPEMVKQYVLAMRKLGVDIEVKRFPL